MRRPAAIVAVAALIAVGLLTGCGKGDNPERITVLAAASLTETFSTLAKEYERAHPNVQVRLVFGASSTLARQVQSGSPGDLIATASTTTLTGVKGVGKPRIFARNRLVIAVPRANPGKVRSLSDLSRAGLRIAVCAPQVPCGAVARQAFATAKVDAKPDTYEQDVKAVLAKVKLGEIDAGLVYRTDVLAAGSAVTGIPIEPPATTSYPILALKQSGTGFAAFVLSARGRAVLAAAGFDPP